MSDNILKVERIDQTYRQILEMVQQSLRHRNVLRMVQLTMKVAVVIARPTREVARGGAEVIHKVCKKSRPSFNLGMPVHSKA